MKRRQMFCLLLVLIVIFPCACAVQGNIVSEDGTGAYILETTGQTDDREQNSIDEEEGMAGVVPVWTEMQPVSALELSYATQFAVDYYEYDYVLLTVTGSGRYLMVPESLPVPQGLDGDIIVLKQPFDHIYLVSTSAMDLICAIDGIGNLRLASLKEDDWYIDEARQAMARGDILYAGKYNAPDYELILSEGCDLAIENTMIYHNPEAKEQLEQLGIPVIVERSSYEQHPLGRMEWMKFYGVLLGREDAAQTYFENQLSSIENILDQENTKQTVAFFYVTSNGAVNVRKSTDYVAKLIDIAGGLYVPSDLPSEENALSTMNMQMEAFYAAAKEADYLIYNSTVDGELQTLEDLFAKSELFRDFKAVKEGHVWCTGKNMFQETTGLGNLILDIHSILTEEDAGEADLHFMHPLK